MESTDIKQHANDATQTPNKQNPETTSCLHILRRHSRKLGIICTLLTVLSITLIVVAIVVQKNIVTRNRSEFSRFLQENATISQNITDIETEAVDEINTEDLFLKFLPGHWIEDENQRENINNYLYEMGMAWFKRVYATSTKWHDEINIMIQNDMLTAKGIRGPLADPFQFTIKLDNKTHGDMDIGKEFGGMTTAIATIDENSVISHVLRPGYSDILFVVKQTIELNNTNVLKVENTHFRSKVVWKSVFNRKEK